MVHEAKRANPRITWTSNFYILCFVAILTKQPFDLIHRMSQCREVRIPYSASRTFPTFLPTGLRIFAHVERFGCLSYCWDLSLPGELQRLISKVLLAMSPRQPVVWVCMGNVLFFDLFEFKHWCSTSYHGYFNKFGICFSFFWWNFLEVNPRKRCSCDCWKCV